MVVKDNLSCFSGLVNRSAFSKYHKNLKDQQLRADLADKLRIGEKGHYDDARFLADNGLISRIPSYSVAVPVGQSKFNRRSERAKRAQEPAKEFNDYLGIKTPLVNHANNQSQLLHSIDEETGLIQRLKHEKDGSLSVDTFDDLSYRFDQYALQSEARELLKRFVRDNGKIQNHPVYRVCNCARSVNSVEGVGIVRSSSTDRVRFSGLQSCGSVWHCPLCASRISEFRATEVRYMSDMWQQSGGGVIFVTNTVRHAFDDDLRMVLEVLFGVVWNRYINHRAYKELREELGYIGRVRAVEVKHGKNGWHPHVHEIWLIKKPLSAFELNDVKCRLYKIWNTTLVNAGMRSVSLARGVTVQPGQNAADYLVKFGRLPKWHLGKELAKSHLKNGSISRTPFDLLRDSLAGDKTAGDLFREYAVAFAGKRQLFFSTGLKDFFLLREKKDEEILQSSDDVLQVLAVLGSDDWKRVLSFGNRAVLLNVASSGGYEAVIRYLDSLPQQ